MKRSVAAGINPSADAEGTLQRALQTSTDEEVRRFLASVRAGVDFRRYRALQLRHLKLRSKPAKFLDLTAWLVAKFRTARDVGLAGRAPAAVLDIGCGPGHFGLACRHLGHRVVGLDVPENPLYRDLLECFSLDMVLHRIRPGQPLPDALGRFDVVTAISANFYQKEDGSLFTVDEWSFFMRDLVTNHMNPGGQIYFKLNHLSDHPGMHFKDEAFVRMMAARGGSVDVRTGVVRYACADSWRV